MSREDAQVITVAGEHINEDEIAGFHYSPGTREYTIILSGYAKDHNGHQSLDYRVSPENPAYEETIALYRSMFRIAVIDEYEDVVRFEARNYRCLQSLHDYLERHGYAFYCELGATRHNYIAVYREQRRIKPQARKSWMKNLIQEYGTLDPEEEDE